MKSSLSILALIVALLLAAAVPSAAAPLPAPCTPGTSYNPACDVDHDGDVDVFDIQLTAGHWNRSGAWTGSGEGWSLTGNTGTNAASNFLGTSDDQPLVVKVNGQRTLLVRPASDPIEAPSIMTGHAGNATLAASPLEPRLLPHRQPAEVHRYQSAALCGGAG